MAVPATPETITGRVVGVNPKGVKLDGHADWRNFSQFARDLVPPARGNVVTLTLDRQGFVRAVETTGVAQESAGANRAAPGPQSAARDRTITRLAVLKAAAEFATARPQLKSGEVLKIAASWERWVNRPESDDLTDAF